MAKEPCPCSCLNLAPNCEGKSAPALGEEQSKELQRLDGWTTTTEDEGELGCQALEKVPAPLVVVSSISGHLFSTI